MCSRIGVTVFGICADAPASAGPESASNTVTRIREDFIFDFLLVQNSWRAPSMNLSLLPGLSLNFIPKSTGHEPPSPGPETQRTK